MVAFLVQTPTGKKEYEGGLNLDNVTEELLNGFFCHYEPPTSENAQFKAARAARADPAKYSHRPVAKPILRTSTLHPKNRKKGAAASKSGSRSDAATAGAGSNSTPSGGKSVTWRDEQTNNERNKVEKEVVGCAVNYCGIFQQGEGLTDVLMSPAEKAAAAKAAASKKASSMKKSSGSNNSVSSPTSTTSTQKSTDESVGSGSKKRLTPILTNRNKKNKTDSPSPAADSAVSGKRILYDDLGNPIAEDEADEETTIGLDESIPGTPGTPATPGSMADTPRTLPDGGVDTPTAEKTGATTVDSNNPLAFFCAVPTAVIGAATIAAASAAEAVGYKSATNNKPTEAPAPPDGTASPSILRRPAPSDPNTGVMAEYRDEVGIYEPLDYNNPFPHITRDPNSGLAYKRVRSPPIRRRQPTPRRARGMSARYEDELYDEADYYTQKVMDDGVVVSSLGKVPRQSTGTFDTSAARQSPGQPPRVYRGQDLSPSTITGATSYQYEQDASGRRLRPAKSPGRRSDIYSDLTMEEEAYIYYQSPTKQGPPMYYDEYDYSAYDSKPRRRSRGEIVEEEARLYYEQQRSNESVGHSRGVDDTRRPRILYGDGEEEQLSPRQYAERFGRQRWEGYCEPEKMGSDETDGQVEEKDDDLGDEAAENLSPRQYAEKYRQQRAAEKTTDRNEEDSAESRRRKRNMQKPTKQNHQTSDPDADNDVKAPAQRDPTPRNSVDPVEAGHVKQSSQLPPTPRRDSKTSPEETRKHQKKSASSTPESHDTFDFSKKTLKKRGHETREAVMDQFSPRSMATDDEIREEVSSVGMASETIRPLYYANPFLNVPPAVLEDEEQNLPLEQIPPKQIGDLDPSTLSGSGSTLSSKPSSNNSGRSSQKERSQACGEKSHPAIRNSSSGSTRSKKLWRGWKKTIGKVKKIVQDIDEQRIHPPHLSHAMNVKE